MIYENEIVEGDSTHILKQLDSESIDCIVTDPPYGYAFMNKDWDKAVVSVDTWKECLRVLKSGAFAFVMSAPRQDVLSRMIVNLQDAGFRTDFTSIYYSYASGFPKASNTKVALSKRYAKTSESQMYEMWRTIIQTSKSVEHDNNGGNMSELLEDLEQGKQYKVYAYTTSESKSGQIPERQRQSSMEGWSMLQKETGQLCYCQICKMPVGIYFNGKKGWICHGTQADNGAVTWQAIDEKGMCSSYQSQPIRQSFRELDIICNECITQKIRDSNLNGSYLGFQPKPAVEVILTVMKPLSQKSFVDQALNNGKGVTWLDSCKINGRFPANLLVSDSVLNGHSKYFDLDAWYNNNEAQFIITPKASSSERNKGCEDLPLKHAPINNYEGRDLTNPKNILRPGMQDRYARNIHPTVKPIKLMSYLITMGSRPNDIILDPFIGSGTTAIAALQLGRRFIGIEKQKEYVEIARKRIEPYKAQTNLLNF